MQALRDYLNNTKQCESILDPDQNQVMDKMTDEMIRNRIREYCTWDGQKYKLGKLWVVANANLEIIKINKDNKGWYIETKSPMTSFTMYHNESKSLYDYCLSKGQKIDKQKGFLIEDIGVDFRWCKHHGSIGITDTSYLESTLGLPEELDILSLGNCCQKSKRLDVSNKIKVIVLANVEDIKISGNGCKNVVIDPDGKIGNIIAPDGVKIHRPNNWHIYISLRKKLSGH